MRSAPGERVERLGRGLMRRVDCPVLPGGGVICGAVVATHMVISLDRVLEAARERRATLTAEVAGYVILLAAQQLAAERFQVSAHSVFLDESGDVFVERAGGASELDVETVLRGLLRELVVLCASPPPAIAAVVERGASGDLRRLVAELSAALIPINHSAAHRALARLHREARRVDSQVMNEALPAIAPRSAEPESALVSEPAELEIDVLVEPDALPRDLPAARPRWLEARSDVQQLLAAFLAETRAVEPMLRVLHDMIGLDVRSHRAGPTSDLRAIEPVPHGTHRAGRGWPA